MRRIRISTGLTATLVLAVVLALGSTGTSAGQSAPPDENAVLYWSGVAAGAIVAPPVAGGPGRPPASSSVLGGMVHGAMYDAVAAVEGGLEPFATGVTAPAGASANAAVATAAADVLMRRVPLQAANVLATYNTYMASIPDGPAKDAGKAVGAVAGAGMLAMRLGDGFDDVVPYVQSPPGAGVFEPIAATPPVDVKLGKVRPFTYGSQSDYRPDSAVRADEQALREGRRRGPGARQGEQHDPNGGADRDRPLPHRADVLPVQPDGARAREGPRPRPARVRTAPGLRERGDRGHDDRLLGGQVPLHVLAPESRDPAGRHRRQSGHLAGSRLAAARHGKPSRVSVRATPASPAR